MTHTARSNRTRIGVGLLVVFAILGFLFVSPTIAQDSGDVEVEIVDFDVEEATVGEEITVEAEITNNRSEADATEIAFEINGSEVDNRTTEQLEPGESETIEFDHDVGEDDAPAIELAVDSGDDRDERTVGVIEEPQFGLEIVDGPPGSVTAGEEIELTVEIDNAGADAEGTDVEFRVDRGVVEARSVDLAAGNSTNLSFSYSTDRRDLGVVDIDIAVAETVESESVTVALPDGVSFAAERTTDRRITVTLDAAEVGENGTVSGDNVTVRTDAGFGWSWDLGDGAKNGMYQDTFTVPSDLSGDESLVNATIEIEDTDLSDTAHLHRVDQTTIAGWTEDDTLYIPLETIGVPDANDVDVSFITTGGEQIDAAFEDQTTIAIDLDAISEVTGPDAALAGTFETDGAPVGSADALGPDIRFLHGEVVLWYPHIESNTDYSVTVHEIDGEETERSSNATASRSGAVPVPNPGTVAGADNVTLSVAQVDGDETLFESLDVTDVSEEHTMNASVTDDGVIEGDRSFERLSVSAVLIETEANSASESMYLTGDEFEVDGAELEVPGSDLSDEHTVQLATDAGIVTVDLQPREGPGLLAVLIPGVILVLTGLGGLLGGGLLGKRIGLEDFIEGVGIGAIGVLVIGLFAAQIYWKFPLPGDVWPHHFGVFLLVVTAIFGYTVGGTLFYRSREEYGTSGTRTTQERQPTATREVSITDGDRPLRERVEIEATDDSGRHPKTRSSVVTGGTGTLTFPEGEWTLRAKLETESGEYTSEPVKAKFSRHGRQSNIVLDIPLPDVSVSVRDAKRDGPVPEASVRMATDGQTETKRTGDAGTVAFDPPLDADAVTLTVDHEKYEETTIDRSIGESGISETVDLRPRTGRLEVVSRIDGVEAGGMDILIEPDEPVLERLYGTTASVEKTTDEDGSFVHDDLIVGRYRVALALPQRFDRHFETSETRASVGRRGETVTLEARFTWDLSDEHRERIGRIRSDLEAVTSKSGIDTAIPRYYASVVEGVLDAVESFPQQGHHFAELDDHPDEVTEATLDAAADTVETISEAMSTKRNLDLFTACSDMAATNVRWGGTFDTGTLADRLREDPMTVRRSFAERADRVSQRIDAERSDLSEIAPARELLERVEIDDSKGGVDSIVSIHVAILLLDAIEELFEHRELRERLSRTVF